MGVRWAEVARGTLYGAALLALGLLAWRAAAPAIELARWRAELLGAEPPRTLPIPVEGVGSDDLGDTWGDPRSGGRRHQGIDIFAGRRTPVRSTTRGIVARRWENALGGRTITILGPGGWRHYYAHLQGYAGHGEGDRVEAGEVIGFVGTSANAPPDAPHLHYGIYTRGGPVNPYLLLARTSERGPAIESGESRAPRAP